MRIFSGSVQLQCAVRRAGIRHRYLRWIAGQRSFRRRIAELRARSVPVACGFISGLRQCAMWPIDRAGEPTQTERKDDQHFRCDNSVDSSAPET